MNISRQYASERRKNYQLSCSQVWISAVGLLADQDHFFFLKIFGAQGTAPSSLDSFTQLVINSSNFYARFLSFSRVTTLLAKKKIDSGASRCGSRHRSRQSIFQWLRDVHKQRTAWEKKVFKKPPKPTCFRSWKSVRRWWNGLCSSTFAYFYLHHFFPFM